MKKRIFHGFAAVTILIGLYALMCVGALAVSADELAQGRTLQPGDEIYVPESSEELTYIYSAGSVGVLKETVTGTIKPGKEYELLTAKKAGLTVDDGWQFSGWYCVLNGGQLMISAQYSAQPTVTLSDMAKAYGLQLSAQRMSSGGKVTVTVPAEYEAYVTEVTVNGTTAEYSKGVWVFTMPATDAVVDVTMNENLCHVVLDAAGGEFSSGESTVDLYVQLVDGFAQTATAEEPEKENYVFGGWSGSGLVSVEDGHIRVFAQPFETVTLSAKWSPDPQHAVTLSFDARGGMTDGDSLLAVPGESIVLPVAWRGGYSFLGWNTEADGSGQLYAADEGFIPNEDATLYACWQAATCTVTVSVKHMGRSVADITAIQLKDEYGQTFVGEDNGTGVYIFVNVPDGEYRLYISDRSHSGSCGGVTLRSGKVTAATLELEMWN